MDPIKKSLIAKNVTLAEVETSKFKTRNLSVNFVMPYKKEYCGPMMILSMILGRCNANYPSKEDFSRKLSQLYGTNLTSATDTTGEKIIISFRANFIDDDYTFNNEKLSEEVLDIILDCIFKPAVSNGEFIKNEFEISKRIVLESILATKSNKRRYAINRMKEVLFVNEAMGISDEDKIKSLESVDPKSLCDFWEEFLNESEVKIVSVGNNLSDFSREKLAKAFEFKNNCADMCFSDDRHIFKEYKSVTEKMDVSQAKLVMGFTPDVNLNEKDVMAAKLMNDIFGGGTYSFLFSEVREKMSLCYYCSSAFFNQKKVLVVDSGVEIENIEKTKNAIVEQLDKIKNGDFDDGLMEKSKLNAENEIKSVFDFPWLVENWCEKLLIQQDRTTVEKFIEDYKSVTKEDVIKVAKALKLETVYVLTGEDKND